MKEGGRMLLDTALSPALKVACYQVSAPAPAPTRAGVSQRPRHLPRQGGDTFGFCFWPPEEESDLLFLVMSSALNGQGKGHDKKCHTPFSSPAGPLVFTCRFEPTHTLRSLLALGKVFCRKHWLIQPWLAFSSHVCV